MDWNWFFSTLSQASAVMVGIFGAFVMAKIFSNQAQFRQKSDRVKSLQATASEFTARAKGLGFERYIRLCQESQLEKAKEFLDKDENLTADLLYAKLNFPPFLKRQDAIATLTVCKEKHYQTHVLMKREMAQEQLAQQQNAKIGKFGSLPFIGLDRDALELSTSVKPARLVSSLYVQSGLQKERDAMDALEAEIRQHMRQIVDFLDTTAPQPELSGAITWVLLLVSALFLVGVVYPLSFLPVGPTWTPALELDGFWERVCSLRGLLLVAVSAIFLVLLGTLWCLNRRMCLSSKALDRLTALTQIGAYCEYYAIAEQNEQRKQKQSEQRAY